MAVRPIDGDAVKRRAWDIAEAWKDQGRDYEALLLKSVVEQIVDSQPTLTQPNEPLTLDSRLTPKMVTCPKGWKGVRYTRFHCPGCKKVLKKGEAYCHKCGQALIFPAARYDKENNRIWLDFSDRRPPEGEAK